MITNTYFEAFNRLDRYKSTDSEIMNWCSPILYFGNLINAKVATLGINPSDKEFIDNSNQELTNSNRRFHTLNSLNLERWQDITNEQLYIIESTWLDYFNHNPYDVWFKRMDYLFSKTSKSYYFPSNEVCHLDLVPFATKTKWGNLSKQKQNKLIDENADLLVEVLQNSKIEYIILNGRTVIDNFQKAAQIQLMEYNHNEIDLIRKNAPIVKGICFEGEINTFRGIGLNRKIRILGYNHNIQSSFGISTPVLNALRNWISTKIAYEK